MQFLISPTCGIFNARRNTPLCPPLSVTPTMAVMLKGYLDSPFNTTDWPVPPPIQTMLGFFIRMRVYLNKFSMSMIEYFSCYTEYYPKALYVDISTSFLAIYSSFYFI